MDENHLTVEIPINLKGIWLHSVTSNNDSERSFSNHRPRNPVRVCGWGLQLTNASALQKSSKECCRPNLISPPCCSGPPITRPLARGAEKQMVPLGVEIQPVFHSENLWGSRHFTKQSKLKTKRKLGVLWGLLWSKLCPKNMGWEIFAPITLANTRVYW